MIATTWYPFPELTVPVSDRKASNPALLNCASSKISCTHSAILASTRADRSVTYDTNTISCYKPTRNPARKSIL
jgi:hypothetical protein